AFQVPYTIQDDARQHVFWMQRFIDPELFPSDPIADYYQSVAPAGIRTLYRFLAWLGGSPILASKLIPPVLFVLDAALAYWLCLAIIPIPAAAFSAALLLSQALAMNDAVFSGTAKGFTYVCGLSVLLCLTRGWLWPFLLAIALQSLFYPQLVLIFAVMLLLGLVERSSDGIQSSWLVLRSLGLRWCQSRKLRVMCLNGFAVAVVVMLPFLLSENEFGPTVTFEQARAMPEFFSGGRVPFFYDDDPLRFWLHGRGGLRINSILTPATNVLGLSLPLLLCFPRQFPLLKGLTPAALWIPRLAIACLAWFVAAHLSLFTLYLPSRFTEHTLRVVMTLCAGIAIAAVVDAAMQGAARGWGKSALGRVKALLLLPIAGAFTALLLFYPALTSGFPFPSYRVGTNPELYKFFLAQPKDTAIASLSHEGSFIPTFARRSVLVDREFSIPYHTGYYRQIRQRASDLVVAQYSLAPEELQQAIAKYDIDFWLLDRNAFNVEMVQGNSWLQQFQPAATAAAANLRSGDPVVLATLRDSCTVFESGSQIVIDANCVTQHL
ncbi:MAG: hypothetical protein AB4040_18135, partial [Synechococcus sp.]